MEGSSQAAVTPQGVRDGDPVVLAALIARRGPAVLAFCEAVCAPEVAPRAAAEAFARFRALVVTVDDTGGVDPEQFLLGATRHAAASLARVPTDDRGVLRVLGRGTSPETYASVPALLAARADSMLGAEDLERLSRLLERSPGCRDVEAAFRRAERGYRSPPERPVAVEVVDLVIAAMQAAAPVADALVVAATEPPTGSAIEAEPTSARADGPDTTAPDAVETAALADHEIVLPDDEPDEEPPDEPAPFLPDAVSVSAAVSADDAASPPAAEPEGMPEPEPAWEIDPDIVPAFAPEPSAGRRRPRLPRPRLPHGGGLPLPRRGSPSPDEAGVSGTVDHGPVYRLVLPAIAVVVAVLVMLAIAGVFGGDDPAPATIITPAARVAPPAPTAATTTPTRASASASAAAVATRPKQPKATRSARAPTIDPATASVPAYEPDASAAP